MSIRLDLSNDRQWYTIKIEIIEIMNITLNEMKSDRESSKWTRIEKFLFVIRDFQWRLDTLRKIRFSRMSYLSMKLMSEIRFQFLK